MDRYLKIILRTDDCVYCDGKVDEKKQTLDYRYHEQLFIIEDVPVGVCNQCGEKYLRSDISKKLEKVVSTSQKGIKTIAIPIISLAA